jgi:hypothetical protein
MGFWENVTKIRIEKKPITLPNFYTWFKKGIKKYIRMLELFPFMFLLVTKFGLNSLWMRITTTLATSQN